MIGVLRFTPKEVQPQRAAILEHQGIPASCRPSAAIESVYLEAVDLFLETAEPVGVLKEIDQSQFARVYEGEGCNDPRTPVAEIAPKAHRLALLAVTLGARIDSEVGARFESNDFALGCMLDSVASMGADALADHAMRRYAESLLHTGEIDPDDRAQLYSPGYCGWHISGQQQLFKCLHPREIGISLRESCLMDPLKSVSGCVLIGRRDIHEFEMEYSCCVDCRTRSCRARISALNQE